MAVTTVKDVLTRLCFPAERTLASRYISGTLTQAANSARMGYLDKHTAHRQQTYMGIHKDTAGLSPTGNIIRDAWVFGILPETETCEGWTLDRIEVVYEKVSTAWEPYGSLASHLTPELRERHAYIYAAAIQLAREQGWDPELGDDD